MRHDLHNQKFERRGRGEGAEDVELEENEIGRLAHELRKARLDFDRQLTLPVSYDGEVVDVGYRIDLLVGGLVVVEIKATEAIAAVHRAQLLSYLRLGGFRLGYLLNFNVALMKDGIARIANGV